MIKRTAVKTIRYLSITARLPFTSNGKKDRKSAHEDQVQVTKYNPNSEKDLRGFEHFNKLNQNQKEYSPIHSEQYRPLSSYGLFSQLSNVIARFLGKLTSHPLTAIASDSLYLPRIHPSSIPIYDSIDKASTYLVLNKLTARVAPISILFFASEPSFALLTYGLLYYVYYGTNWKTIKHLVIKCELLPNTEEIAYQKISIFGSIITKRAKISDLNQVSFSDIFGENNFSEKSVRGLYNREVAFQIRGTKEILLFDKHGIWNEEGINHPLLN